MLPLWAFACVAAAPSSGNDAEFARLLDRLGRTSLLYADTVLRFSCDETLRATPGGTFRDSYIYVFGEDGRFHDYRTRRGDRKGAAIPPDRMPIRRYLTQALSWVFQFHPARHDRIRFTLLGTGTALGVRAVVIGFEPVFPIEADVNEWSGTAWIDPRTAQVLKVEAFRDSDMQERHRYEFQRAYPSGETDRFHWSIVTTEFGHEAHGLRFPSLAVIETRTHTLAGPEGRETVDTDYLIRQIYENYRFFSVRSADEIERLTAMPPPPPSR